VILCLFVSVQSTARRDGTISPTLPSTYYSYHNGFVGSVVSSDKYLHLPRGGETNQGTDERAMAQTQLGRNQYRDPLSLISAFRVLHKRSMLVKEEELESVVEEEGDKHGLKCAAVEVSSSFTANSADYDQIGSSSVYTECVAGDQRSTETKDSQTIERKGNNARGSKIYSQQGSIYPSKSRRMPGYVGEKKTVKRDKSRQSRQIGPSKVEHSTVPEDERNGKDPSLIGTGDSVQSMGLDGNVSFGLNEIERPTSRKDNVFLPLFNYTESSESLYISSGHVS
jgi:hypothetical protein